MVEKVYNIIMKGKGAKEKKREREWFGKFQKAEEKIKKMGADPHEKNRSSAEILKKSARAKNKIWRRLGRGGRSARPLKNFALTPLALQKEIPQFMFTVTLFFPIKVYK